MDEDDLMFGEMERVVEKPFDQGMEDEAAIRASCEKEIELYILIPEKWLDAADEVRSRGGKGEIFGVVIYV